MAPIDGQPGRVDVVTRPPRMPAWVRSSLVAGVAGVVMFSGWLWLGGAEHVWARDVLLYCLLYLPALVSFGVRWRVEDATRAIWGLLSSALVIWVTAEIGLVFTADPDPGGAWWVQALFLLVAPLIYVALVLLIRRAMPGAAVNTYLDGLIIALAIAAALSLPKPWNVQDSTLSWHDTFFAFSYPAVDLLQIALILAAIAMLGRATGPAWWWLLSGTLLIWIADSFWLFQLSLGDAFSTTRVDMLWPLGALLMSVSAWSPVRRGVPVQRKSWVLPMLVTAGAFTIIVAATFLPVSPLTVALATGAVVTGALRSISAFRAASARSQAQLLARTDDLTGLQNRRGLTDFSLGRLEGTRALLLVDIDRFKQINDTLGHQAGDEVLRGVAARFLGVVPSGVALARIGGDEFALLTAEGSTAQAASELAAALHSSMNRPLTATGIELSVELSVGIALAPEHGRTLSALLLSADRAMYRAKRDHVSTQIFDPSWEGGGTGNLLILQDLRTGLERDDFVCFYQPQLDVVRNEVVAVEALVRWEHPEQGLIAAGDFLPMVEQTTLIRPLTDTILDKALRQLRHWDAQGIHVRLSVNVSATNLMDRALPMRITQLLAGHHVDAKRLTLEITETALSGDEERVRVVLGQLHQIGVEISIDDYGSGYSSLHQIGALGASELKLDREFVTGVGERGDLRSILSATVHLAHGLRLRMVAEGVESASDLDQVRLSGCDLAQGYHISPPLDGENLVAWLAQRAERVGDQRLRY